MEEELRELEGQRGGVERGCECGFSFCDLFGWGAEGRMRRGKGRGERGREKSEWDADSEMVDGVVGDACCEEAGGGGWDGRGEGMKGRRRGGLCLKARGMLWLFAG